MKRLPRILLVLLLIGALIAIRMFEDWLFYDPLLDFFKTDHSTEALPEMNQGQLALHLIFRFVLNTAISLAVIWALFRDMGFVKLSVMLYGVFVVVLLPVFWYLVVTSEGSGHLTLFYVRRFLIQPVFLLVLLPAFYFHKRNR